MESPPVSAINGPLVSVILPVHNRAGWVNRAIESVLAQTYQRFELLVIDDGSTDDTYSVLEKFKSQQITVLKQSNAGAESARNLGLEHARGDFVAFIDSDDVWYPDRLSMQLPLFEKKETGLVFGNAAVVDYARGGVSQRKTFFDGVRPSRGRVMRDLARGCFVPFSSVLIRRKCFDDVGGFTGNCVAADYMKWVEISVKWEFDYVPSPLFEYAVHPGGLSYNLIATLEDRLNSFRGMLAQNDEPKIKRVVRHILFNTFLSLCIAQFRYGMENRRQTERPYTYIQDVSLPEKLIWSVAFGCNQIRTRVRWELLNQAHSFQIPSLRLEHSSRNALRNRAGL